MRLYQLLCYPLALILLSCGSDSDAANRGSAKNSDVAETVFYFTRHAEKAEGKDPGLLPAGQARAASFVRRLGGEDIAAVYATNFRRTQATAAPLAKAMGLKVQTYSASGNANKLTKEWLRKNGGKTIFVVGHSNTVPGMVNALLGQQRYSDIAEDNYDELFKVTVDGKGKGRVEKMSTAND